MVSAQIEGTLKFYRVDPTNSRTFLWGASTQLIGTGGSSEGSIVQTQEKWALLPVQNAPKKILQVNDKLLATFTPTGAATTDASDGQVALAITRQDGSTDVLGGFDDANVWDSFVLGDVALIAGREYPVAEKIVREAFALGSNKMRSFASIENNA